MASKNEDVDLTIRAKNATEAAFKAVSQALKVLEDETEKQGTKTKSLGDHISAYFTKQVDVYDIAKKSALAVGAAVAASAAGIVALGLRGSTVIGVSDAFQALATNAGQSGEAMLASSRAASRGVVTDMEIMAAANKGLLLGLPLTADGMGTLASTSIALGKAMQVGPAQALNDLITGLGRGSAQILDNLGILVDAEAAYRTYGAEIGKAHDELTTGEQKIAIYKAAVAAASTTVAGLGEEHLTFTDRLARVRVGIQNVIDKVAVVIADSPVVNAAMKAIGDALDAALGAQSAGKVSELGSVITKLAFFLMDLLDVGVSVADGIGRAWGVLSMIFNVAASIVLTVGKALVAVVEGAVKLARVVPGVDGALKGLDDTIDGLQGSMHVLTLGFDAQAAEALNAVKGNSAYHDGLDRVRGVLGTVRERMAEALKVKKDDTDATAKATGVIGAHGATLTQVSKVQETFEKNLKTLTTALRAGADQLSDSDFVAKFGSDLDKARIDLELFGVTGTRVPAAVAEALERLGQIRLSEMLSGNLQDMRRAMATIAAQWAKDGEEAGKRALAGMTTNLKGMEAAYKTTFDLVDRRRLSSYEYQVSVIQREADAKKAALDQHHSFYAEAMAAIDQETSEKMRDARLAHDAELANMTFSERSWANSFREIAVGIPDLLRSALTGGGGVSGFTRALTSQLGEMATTNLFAAGGALNGLANTATKGVSNLLGKSMGDAFALALPGVGSLLGPLISKGLGAIGSGIKKLFGGPSQDELAGRDLVAQFEQQLQSLLTTQQRVDAGNRSWAMTTIAVRDAYIATGRSAAEGEAAVAKLWASSKSGAEASKAAIAEITGVFDEQQQKQERLQAAIERYGFTIEELGPTFQRQRLSEMALQLVDDFGLLVESGISVGNVTGRMSDAINHYLALAIRTGQEVPAAMRPIAEQLAEQGLLYDENGEKVTDVGKLNVTWSQTMTQGFQSVVERLDRVIERLGGVRTGLLTIPDSVESEILITERRRTIDDGFYADPVDSYAGIEIPVPGAAAGGMFSTPTFRVVAERGPEMVGSPDLMIGSMAEAMRRHGGSGLGDHAAVEAMREIRVSQDRMLRALEAMPIAMARSVRDHMQLGRA